MTPSTALPANPTTNNTHPHHGTKSLRPARRFSRICETVNAHIEMRTPSMRIRTTTHARRSGKLVSLPPLGNGLDCVRDPAHRVPHVIEEPYLPSDHEEQRHSHDDERDKR